MSHLTLTSSEYIHYVQEENAELKKELSYCKMVCSSLQKTINMLNNQIDVLDVQNRKLKSECMGQVQTHTQSQTQSQGQPESQYIQIPKRRWLEDALKNETIPKKEEREESINRC